jgi:outer membrane protein OmpA-like peptidoglycan-associated protein
MNFPGLSARVVRRGALVIAALATAACGWSNKAKGSVIGAGAGAAAGAAIGKNNGSTARGAIIGAAVGGAAGAVIGHQMDQQAKSLRVAIPGATVTRVGEGMVVTFESGLLYDFDSDAIRRDAAVNLRNLASSLKEYPNTELLIVGHTDAVGSSRYNEDLSLRRANAAEWYLSQQGVRSSRMRASGRGEYEAVASNNTEAGRQANRRIEVAIYAGSSARTGSR